MSLPVISVPQMREWERATWASGQSEAEVISRVGKKVARVALRLTHADDLILLLAGPGHNGDDVRAAREHLPGRHVALLNVSDPVADLAKLEAALASSPALLVDGLFGIGLNRPLDVAWIQFIGRINETRARVLAVDVPSGLNADTGETHGAAIQAQVTLTVGAPKAGLLRPGAGSFVGRLEVAADVGLLACPHPGDQRWTVPEDFAGFPPARPAEGHKSNFGHLAILAGSLGYHGAAVLAARGAQRAQPGLITLYTHEPVYHAVAPQLQAVMVNLWSPTLKFPGAFSTVLLGPGLAAPDLPDEMKMIVRRMWRDLLVPVIADASALDWLPLGPVPRNTLRVVTPHPGEAGRLLKCSSQQVQANRPHALREISHRLGNSWVVLKGQQTLLGRSTGDLFINSSGNPHLAQGGSGDVLAGFLAALLAQPALQTDAARTLRYAIWQHGAAADALSATRANWIVEDLLGEIGNARHFGD